MIRFKRISAECLDTCGVSDRAPQCFALSLLDQMQHDISSSLMISLVTFQLICRPEIRKRVGTNTLRRGAGVCWTWDMDMPDLPVIGKRCSRPGTPTR